MNEELTRLQALQVQQQLGVQALSIANGNASRSCRSSGKAKHGAHAASLRLRRAAHVGCLPQCAAIRYFGPGIQPRRETVNHVS